MKIKIKNKALAIAINLLPFIFMVLGLVAFVIGAFIVNKILGTFALGVAFVLTGLMIIPIKIEGDD